MDEYPYHQITETFAGVAGSDPQWNDGHYICAADQAGAVSVASNLRLYQNNDVLDGFVCVRHEGRQHNLRLSRRLRPDIDTLAVGPLRLEIVRPLDSVRLLLDANDHGISLDITCRTVGVPYMGPIEVTRVDGRLLSERATYELAGRASGWVQVGTDRVALDEGSASFFRNHSWGNQGGRGGPRHGAPGPSRRARGVRQWVLLSMPAYSGFFFEDPSGRAASGRGALLRDEGVEPLSAVRHELDFYPEGGGRRLRSGTFTLVGGDGVERDFRFDDLGWIYCQGGGYFGGFDDGLGQGVYRGDYHVEGEVWDVSHPTEVVAADGSAREFDHAWAESFVRLAGPGGEPGLAHYECVVLS